MRQPGDRLPAPGELVLVQDLANTLDIEGGHEELGDIAGLAAFCAARGLPRLRLTNADLLAVHELREAIRDGCAAHVGVAVPAASLTALRRLFARAPLVVAVDEVGAAWATPASGLDGAAALTAAVASAILSAVVDDCWQRLKACTAHECRWVYYDHSPGGRSRWCTMSICGSRAKMRAYRERTR